VTTQAFTGNPVAFVAVKRTGGSVGFPLYFVVTVMADEFENSCVNSSRMGPDYVFSYTNFFAWHRYGWLELMS
jgi:hypothetical protein